MKLALGTVQFGLPYGVANQHGQVDVADAGNILAFARNAGVDTLDTAIGYGDSEQHLGAIGVSEWKVVTKLPPFSEVVIDASQWVSKHIAASLERLQVQSIYGVLLHRSEQLLDPTLGPDIWRHLTQLKVQGVVQKIGYSIYNPSELDLLWERFQPDIIQAPYNVLDRRLKSSGWMGKLNKANVEIHARSVFLQGLLLMPAEKRPNSFERWNDLWALWDAWLNKQGINALEAALGFVVAEDLIDRVIVGVDTLQQLVQVISAVDSAPVRSVPDELSITDQDLINPSNW